MQLSRYMTATALAFIKQTQHSVTGAHCHCPYVSGQLHYAGRRISSRSLHKGMPAGVNIWAVLIHLTGLPNSEDWAPAPSVWLGPVL